MADRRFVVSCQHCKRVVMAVTLVGAEELDRLSAHLLACCPSEMVGPSPGVEATMRHYHVAPTTPEASPDAA